MAWSTDLQKVRPTEKLATWSADLEKVRPAEKLARLSADLEKVRLSLVDTDLSWGQVYPWECSKKQATRQSYPLPKACGGPVDGAMVPRGLPHG